MQTLSRIKRIPYIEQFTTTEPTQLNTTAISLGTLVPNSRDRQGKLWLPKKQKMALKTTLQ